MKILVTGASGFVGLNVLERLLAAGHHVIGVSADDFPAQAQAEFERLPGRLEPVRADVRDEAALERLIMREGFEAVLAAAAITAGAERERTAPGAIIEVNLAAVAMLIALSGRHGVRRLVALSSSAVLGERLFGERPAGEDESPAPTTLYGMTKAGLESLQRRWAVIAAAAPQVVIARVSAVFGPWESVTALRDLQSPPFQIARAAVRGAPIGPLPSAGDRDWVYASYVAQVLEWLLCAPRLNHGLYNIGAGCTWHPGALLPSLADAGMPVVQQAGASVIAFNDDLTRRRTWLDVARIAAEHAPPPDPLVATRAYAAWVAAHRAWLQ